MYWVTQENLKENSVQVCLPYIPNYMVCASYYASYPKLLCVSLKVNVHYARYMILSFQNVLHPSIYHVTVTVIVSCDVTDM